MIFAHAVPAYFAVRYSQRNWLPKWNRWQQVGLWSIAIIGSAIFPDLDVIHNILTTGQPNHYYDMLWTHSIFPYLTVGFIGLFLHIKGHKPYLKWLCYLFAIGGLSHLILDMIVHNTPVLFPLTLQMFGTAPARIVQIGFWAYVTDIFMVLEFFLLAMMALDMISRSHFSATVCSRLTLIVISLTLFISALFVALLPSFRTALGI